MNNVLGKGWNMVNRGVCLLGVLGMGSVLGSSFGFGMIVYSGMENKELPHVDDAGEVIRTSFQLSGAPGFLNVFNETRDDQFILTADRGGRDNYSMIFDNDIVMPVSFDQKIDAAMDWEGMPGFILLAAYGADVESFRGPLFDQENQYFPIRTDVDSDTYYGWLRLSHSMENEVLTVHDWAWNSESGEPIQAGEIPEPGKVALIAGVVAMSGVMFFHRRRRNGRCFDPS